ncbi:hypothetical protein GCM10010335_30010 [Streptomyces galbus]|nr:hypothetical protein GCM10010335_30010 [Streptomyces galbus]
MKTPRPDATALPVRRPLTGKAGGRGRGPQEFPRARPQRGSGEQAGVVEGAERQSGAVGVRGQTTGPRQEPVPALPPARLHLTGQTPDQLRCAARREQHQRHHRGERLTAQVEARVHAQDLHEPPARPRPVEALPEPGAQGHLRRRRTRRSDHAVHVRRRPPGGPRARRDVGNRCGGRG